MKGLFNLLRSICGIGHAGYDPELHKFTFHHFWLTTRWYLLAITVVTVAIIFWSKTSQWYAAHCLKSGDQRARRGDHKGAIRCYTTAINWWNEYPLAYHNRGMAEVA